MAEERSTRRTIYVRAEDAELWVRLERFAKARRMAVSAVILTAVEAYLDAEEGERQNGQNGA